MRLGKRRGRGGAFALGLAWVLLAGWAHADVLVFKNGDRLSGRLVRQEGGYFYFESGVLGLVRVRSDQATVAGEAGSVVFKGDQVGEVVEEGPEAADDSTAEEAVRPSIVPTPPGRPETAEEAKERTLPALVNQITELPDRYVGGFFTWFDGVNPFDAWKSKFELGYIRQTGESDRQESSLRLLSDRNTDEREMRISLAYDYAFQQVSEGERSTVTDRYRGSFRYRHDLGERSYWQSLSRLSRDKVQGIDLQAEQNVGLGYAFLNRERLRLALTPSIGVQYVQLNAGDDRQEFVTSILEEFEWRLNGNMRLLQDLSITVAPPDFEEVTWLFTTNFENKITERLNLNVRYEYEYLREVTDIANRERQIISTSLGVNF